MHVVQIPPEPQPLLGDGEPGLGLAGLVELVDDVEQPDGDAAVKAISTPPMQDHAARRRCGIAGRAPRDRRRSPAPAAQHRRRPEHDRRPLPDAERR